MSQLLTLAGLRQLEELVEEAARKVPVLNDVMDNKVLGRAFKKGVERGRREGELAMLRRLITARFAGIPAWAEERLANRLAEELEEVGVGLLNATSLEQLLKSRPGE